MDALTRDLLLAQDGDLDAFNRVVSASESDIRRFCTWLTGASSDVDDLVQETLLRVLRGVGAFRGDAPGMSWILTIARRICLDESRHKMRRQRNTFAIQNQGWLSVATSDHSSSHEIMDLVTRLPEPLRETFILVRIMEYSYAETGRIQSIPTGTVQSRVSRARALLAVMHDESSGSEIKDTASG